MQSEVKIHGGEISDLVTKFFYKEDHLCFQILLQMKQGETVLFQEFNDYSEYKHAMSDLQQAKRAQTFISISKNNLKVAGTEIKVA